jgi:hypothetical protein
VFKVEKWCREMILLGRPGATKLACWWQAWLGPEGVLASGVPPLY